MKLYVVTVRDRKAMVFGQPQVVANIPGAIRNFSDQIADPASGIVHKHPEDFDFYLLASYDDETGLFSENTPQQIAAGVQSS
ncbi:nonstructural protein [Blackfly microvirus SF02]|uniref:Nonstructural protein n=1 Tax=Blackfly microvirus SF02 TaxID=2576452 RepID=A0A4V1F5H1_9VIRU|nr:nonstructural protein [Blackfly microvirus SF02]